jgi:hypothetical protein
MSRYRHLALAPLALAFALPPVAVGAAELDPAAVAYKLPQDIQWRESPSGSASAVLHGNPAETGLSTSCW